MDMQLLNTYTRIAVKYHAPVDCVYVFPTLFPMAAAKVKMPLNDFIEEVLINEPLGKYLISCAIDVANQDSK